MIISTQAWVLNFRIKIILQTCKEKLWNPRSGLKKLLVTVLEAMEFSDFSNSSLDSRSYFKIVKLNLSKKWKIDLFRFHYLVFFRNSPKIFLRKLWVSHGWNLYGAQYSSNCNLSKLFTHFDRKTLHFPHFHYRHK